MIYTQYRTFIYSTAMEILILLAISVHLAAADTHSMRFFYTGVTPGIHFPEFTIVGLLDGEQFVYYDSKIRKFIPKTEWMEKNEGPDYWDRETQKQHGAEEVYKANVAKVMQRFNQTKGVHTVQEMYGCELDDDGTTTGYDQHGYDGEDFISFDLKTLTWIAPTPQAVITKNKLDPDTGYNKGMENYLEKECIDWLKKHLSYGRETLERKVRPEVSVFQKHSPSAEVVCHATGFFPKAVVITWQKDGEDVHEDVEIRETLPNQDGSFQKRSILKVPAEELQKHNYTCVVQHSSLEKEIREGIPGPSGARIAVIVAVVAALVALVAVVAGIVVWKKKNSGFKPVPLSSTSSVASDSSSSSSESGSETGSLCRSAELRQRDEKK